MRVHTRSSAARPPPNLSTACVVGKAFVPEDVEGATHGVLVDRLSW